MATFLELVEHSVKKPVWDCRMCGQCVLHSTGLTCPMTCPKMLRNGPCGGVRPDGHCEVKPEMRCVWVKAWRRSEYLPWSEESEQPRPPVDNQLWGTASWKNLLTGRDKQTPQGWDTAFGDPAGGDTGCGNAGCGDMACGDTAVRDTAVGDTAFGSTAHGGTAYGGTALGDTVFGDTVFGDTAFGDTAVGDGATAFGDAEASAAARENGEGDR